MEWTDIRLTVAKAEADNAEAVATMIAEGGIYIEDYSDIEQQVAEIAHVDLIEQELLDKPRDTVIIHMYLEPGASPVETLALIQARMEAAGIAYTVETEGVEQEDWQNGWRKYYHPMDIGKRLAIVPSWQEYDTDRVKLILDPGLAFGTGGHETTSLCLEALDEQVRGTALRLSCSGTLRTLDISPQSESAVYEVQTDYFACLNDFGKNEEGTCTVIAAAILFGYYDIFVNNAFVDIYYRQGNGTNDAFHQLLNSYVYGSQPKGAIFIHEAANGLNRYLSSRNVTARLCSEYATNNSARTKILNELAGGRPVIASMKKSLGAEWNHSVVVYRATFDSANPLGTATLQMHCGWLDDEPHCAFVASISWFYECGYLTCLNGHSGVWKDNGLYTHIRTCTVCGNAETEAHSAHWNPLLGKCIRCGRTGSIAEPFGGQDGSFDIETRSASEEGA